MPIFTVLIKAEFKSDEVLKFATSEELQYGVLPNVLSTIRIGEQEWDADCTFVSSTSSSSKMTLWGSLTIPITFNIPRNSPDVAKEVDHYVRMLEKSKAFIRGAAGSGTPIEKKPRPADIKVLPPLLETFPVSASMPAEAKVFADYVNENGLWVEDRMELADSTATADWKLGRLAFDPVPQVRALVASNSQTSELTLRLLATNNHRKSTPPEELVSGENRDWVFYNPASDFKKLADDDFLAPLLQGQDAAISELAEAELTRRGITLSRTAPEPKENSRSQESADPEISFKRITDEAEDLESAFNSFREWTTMQDALFWTSDPAVIEALPQENIWTECWSDEGAITYDWVGSTRTGVAGYFITGVARSVRAKEESWIYSRFDLTCPNCYLGEYIGVPNIEKEDDLEARQDEASSNCQSCNYGSIRKEFASQLGISICNSVEEALADFNTRRPATEAVSAPNNLASSQTDESTTPRARFCESCGQKFSENAAFCESCGTKRS